MSGRSICSVLMPPKHSEQFDYLKVIFGPITEAEVSERGSQVATAHQFQPLDTSLGDGLKMRGAAVGAGWGGAPLEHLAPAAN